MERQRDEMTSLISANSTSNRRRKCVFSRHFSLRRILTSVYLLLLLTEVVAGISMIYFYCKIISPIFTSDEHFNFTDVSSKNVTHYIIPAKLVSYLNFTKTFSKMIMAVNFLDTLNCWIFLGVFSTSAHFIGCSAIVNDLIRVPRFWTLIFCFVLYFVGNVLEVISPLMPVRYKFKGMMVVCLTFVLSGFSIMIMLGVLNHCKVRHLVPDHTYLLFKGALIVFCFRLIVFLIVTIFHLTVILYLIAGVKNTFWVKGGAFTNSISSFLFLPFYKKGTELIWTKIFRDEKCIIGKINSTARQNTGLSNGIQTV